jgi:DNA-binding transcriptional MerR regulator
MGIDLLAARSGVSSRTIRFYQSVGVLQPPRRSGRVAVYDEEHLTRLQLVAMLQDRGLRLSAIADLVSAGDPQTLSMSAWLGLSERLATAWAEETPQHHDHAGLDALVESTGLTAADLAELGLASADGAGGWVVPSPGLLDVTLGLTRVGITPETAANAAGILRRHLGAAAEDLIVHFSENIGRGVGRGGGPEELGRALEGLRPHAAEAVRIIFAQEVARRLARLSTHPQTANVHRQGA